MLGVFRRYGVLVGAICVGFVHHAFYEIFDHRLQLRWWEWTLQHPMNQPFFASVPLPSVVVFAALWPMSLAFCVQLLSAGMSTAGVGILGSRTGSGAPSWWAYWRVDRHRDTAAARDARRLAVRGGHGGRCHLRRRVGRAGRGCRTGAVQDNGAVCAAVNGGYANPAILIYAGIYLVVMTGLWVSALPDYVGAVDGVAHGDPVGSIFYTVVCHRRNVHRGGGERGTE